MIFLRFDSGTITLSSGQDAFLPGEIADCFTFDPRSSLWRAPAHFYARTVLALRCTKTAFTDEARDYLPLETLALREKITPYPHQQTALQEWTRSGCRGIVSLPTGSGKTILAILAIAQLKRPTLVLVPTIDLLVQWTKVLEKFLNHPVSMLGGGSHQVGEITVSTYDSAVLNIEFIGSRFALLIADECHHLPAPETRLCAAMSIAPFRLGLSATPELDEERQQIMTDLLGEIVCDTAIDELEGKILANYQVKKLHVGLTPEESAAYKSNREIYTGFLRSHRINFNMPDAWQRFLWSCARFPGGKEALKAFFTQRQIARAGSEKLLAVKNILLAHTGERVLIFTADNHTAYHIGRTFTLPVLTHHTKAAERKEFLELFKSGQYPVLVTSKVLNEGVDVPEASVGIVVSGSGSVREHVQRLGRILRPAAGKPVAVLYELVSVNTSEESISQRRREHRAYRRRY